MRNIASRTWLYLLRGASLGLIIASISLTFLQWIQYQKLKLNFPPAQIIAGVPVGGTDRQTAADRLRQAYGTPIEIHYGTSTIQASPQDLGFQLDIDAMLSAAENQQDTFVKLAGFWKYLWHPSDLMNALDVPLRASVDETAIQNYLKDVIAPRYTQPPTAPQPAMESLSWIAGHPGISFDMQQAIEDIKNALFTLNQRKVTVLLVQEPPPPPDREKLQFFLQTVIDRAAFDGLVEIYLSNLQSGEKLHFAYQNGTNPPADIAFTAASTIKIPIMISVFRRLEPPIRDDIQTLLNLMISESENEASDKLMETVINPVRGPLMVTEDMRALGLNNTFLAGYFYMDAPLLERYHTPANTRTDIDLKPDVYNQTTPAEMGTVLEAIYQCAETNSGKLVETFIGEITQDECREMIDLLVSDKLPYLITAGLPEGTRIGHKHGWIEEADGLLHTMSDGAIIYSQGGNYVLAIYMYHPKHLIFDQGNQLMANLSTVIYNYFNLTTSNANGS